MASSASTLALAARRMASLVFLGILPVVVLIYVYVIAQRTGTIASDFHGEIYPQAKEMLAGHNPYPPPDADLSDGASPIWPPIDILLVAPLTLLPLEPAGVVMATAGLVCFALALWVVGVRDWRVYGASALWPPVISEIRTGHFTLVLCLLVAIAWRTRDRHWRSGIAVGLATAIKFFLWPLMLWLVAIRRYREAIIAGAIAGASLLLLLPFTGPDDYVRLVLNLGRTFDQDSYSPFGLLAQAGVPQGAAKVVGLVLAAAVLILAWWRRSLALFITVGLLVSPIVWLDYYALLAIPLAIARPTFSLGWLIPLPLLGLSSAGLGIGDVGNTTRVLVVIAALIVYVVHEEGKAAGEGRASRPRSAWRRYLSARRPDGLARVETSP